MGIRNILINAARSHYAGHINKHLSNVEVLLERPAGISEHQDIQEAIEIELGHIADYHDKLEMLNKFFIKQEEEIEDDNETK
tara:strand:+ start:561 stop:806 length:246 start_codon:yes stop_codon:yes gene_type:complete